ncbi:MAG: Mlr7830 protein, partial [uncultured Thermomicrobiales bacterium]
DRHPNADPARAPGPVENALRDRPGIGQADLHRPQRHRGRRPDQGPDRRRGGRGGDRLGRRRPRDGRRRGRPGLLRRSTAGVLGGLPGDHGADGRRRDEHRPPRRRGHRRRRPRFSGHDGRRPGGACRIHRDPDRDPGRSRRPRGPPAPPRRPRRALLRGLRHPAERAGDEHHDPNGVGGGGDERL